MRNIFLAAAVSFAGTAWAVNPAIGRWPLVGPGSLGKLDLQAADAGAGPHEHFRQQFERRVDPPGEQVAAVKKEQAKKTAENQKAEPKAGAGATR